MTDQIQLAARFIDLSPRFVVSNTVAASPSGSSETTVCTVAIPGNLAVATGVFLFGWAAYTVGTNGVSVQLKIRQTNTSGTAKADSGATTATAANLGSFAVLGVDTSPVGAQVYVLTMTVASGSAASTVSAATLIAAVV